MLSSIIGSNAQSTATSFRKTLPNESCFCLSELEWEQIAPTKPKSGRNRFSEGWTDIFVRHMKKTNPFCSFSFKSNRVKSSGSRKRRSPYFRSKASCSHPGCPVNATIIIKPEDETSRKVTVQYSDAVFYCTKNRMVCLVSSSTDQKIIWRQIGFPSLKLGRARYHDGISQILQEYIANDWRNMMYMIVCRIARGI